MFSRIKKAFLLSLAAVTLCGCSINFSVEELLSPPKLTKEQNEIFIALKKIKGENISLKYPRTGDYRSAFVIKNLDSEKSEEAVVFYKQENGIRLSFLDKKENESFDAICDFAIDGAELDRVYFETLGGSEFPSLIVVTTAKQGEKNITVFKYDAKNTSKKLLYSADVFELMDIDFDGKNELVFINNVEQQNSHIFSMNYKNDEIIISSYAELDKNALEYQSVIMGNRSSGNSAVFIDYKTENDKYATQAVRLSGGKMTTAKIEQNNIIRETNKLTPMLSCTDIDNDGIIEMPLTSAFPMPAETTKDLQINAVSWMLLTSGTVPERKYYTIPSPNSDYSFIIPNRWEGLVSAEYNSNLSELYFYEIASGENLLKIKTLSEKGENLLVEAEEKFYCYESNSLNPLSLTESEIFYSFNILNNGKWQKKQED